MDRTANIDPAEVKKFSDRADDWWNPDGAFRTLHDINPVRLAFIQSRTALKDATVLDVGCGGGLLTEAMAAEGAVVTGIDASPEAIAAATDHAKENALEIDYITTDTETFSATHQGEYDLITCMELLEHVPEPDAILKACAEMVKPGGHVILSTIHRNLKAYLLTVIASEHLLKLLPKGTHQYKNFIRPSELVNGCEQVGLTLQAIKGLHYNPLLHHCRLTDRPDVNYLVDTVRDSA